jgi:hypothetical protein
MPACSPTSTRKAEHPFWGYQRIWAYVHFMEHLAINKKHVLRVMREPHLLVQPPRQFKATRPPSRSKPRPTTPQEWWGIDMTKVMEEVSSGLGFTLRDPLYQIPSRFCNTTGMCP